MAGTSFIYELFGNDNELKCEKAFNFFENIDKFIDKKKIHPLSVDIKVFLRKHPKYPDFKTLPELNLKTIKSQGKKIVSILNALVEKICFDYDYLIYDMESKLVGVHEDGVFKDGVDNFYIIETIVSHLKGREPQPFPEILTGDDVDKIETPDVEDKFTYLTKRSTGKYLNEAWVSDRNLDSESCDFVCKCDDIDEDEDSEDDDENSEDDDEYNEEYGYCKCPCYCNE